ncbi:ABC transporter permease [Ketogulonicigenium vulgare]|uniref:Peptide ABC transporter, permease protein, putative n=1 Tax=Ketogulonicigenium vulgare (strain WSH-001) TaxID=759362 RepID=F9Y792_KETVW|nr:ABC transporter permease [Ketogulonicigenium vulgare]ADO42834.1 putative transport system permease protein [Ketogulonicigenium vulgare Y25]AEM41020.1 Peptide ABC transporter, permease protein, putative [Ketogulonicigenium vulgare WSH-001]ALJ81171.1 ABC transporter permease [Ketogulonicigenium vulgare]ANW33916.1 ABC transporter permease [Ketogulonicigenium vulgare]AOZ54747.1 transporter permease [Ketogulonicigenium vulgare]
MLVFILRRLAQSVVVMLAVALIAFLIFRYVGDPIASMVGQDTRLEDMERMRQELGLNDPFYVQFWTFITNAVQGNFGISYRLQLPVTQLIFDRLPATLELALVSVILALFIGVGLGIFTALRRKSFGAGLIMSLSLVGVSLPTFLIGIGLIYIFAVELQWLPSFGRGETVQIAPWWRSGFFTQSGLRSLILPAITLSLFQMTLIMRLVRSEMLEVLRQDYIRFARARGLPERAINFRHALKNTLVPVITITGLQLGSIIAFAVVTETVFQWPGVGSLFINSVQVVDVPVMAAYLMFIALVFVMINLVVDILYYLVDPRLRIGARAGA